jgi:hypothetical protein
MEFLDIPSLGTTYRYVVKIEKKFKQKQQEFGSANPSQLKQGKGNPNPHSRGPSRDGRPQDNPSKPQHKKGNEKTKKDTGKWCEYHKSPWHDTDECRSKKSLVAKLKDSELEADSDSESNIEGGKHIIILELSAMISTTNIQPSEQEEPEKGERLFCSQMWVKGSPIHFIFNKGSQKNLISAEIVKRLNLSTTPHPQPYTIGWLHQGRDLCVNQQLRMSYGIKPFKEEVLCDIPPLEVCDVILGKPYLWKCHVVYDSRPRSFIITLGIKLFRIPEVAPPTAISLIFAKQCSKVISQTKKFVFFVIHSHNKKKVFTTSVASTKHLTLQQKQVDEIME